MEWSAANLVACLGARIGVRSNDRQVLRRLARRLPPHAEVGPWGPANRIYSVRATGGTPKEHALFRNRTEIMRSRSAEEIVDLLASELNESVARFASDLFVHAGVVGWRGRAIVVPGLSMSGKSTLVAELIRQGASYYSDEYAVIGEDGQIIHSYPKPLSMRRPKGKPQHLSAKSLGGKIGRTRLPLGLIVVAKYRSGATWEPRPLSEAESMMALMANTVMARARPEMTMQRLARAVQGAIGLEGRRGDAKEVAHALIRLADKLFRRRT
jgi:hypothetical protein